MKAWEETSDLHPGSKGILWAEDRDKARNVVVQAIRETYELSYLEALKRFEIKRAPEFDGQEVHYRPGDIRIREHVEREMKERQALAGRSQTP